FKEYRSGTGWRFSAVTPGWVEMPGERTERGFAARTLLRAEDRKVRVSFFETELPKDRLRGRSLHPALSYLFKADPDSTPSASESVPAGVSLFRPPQHTLRHWGMLARNDSTLLFVHVESKTPLAPGEFGRLVGISMGY